MDKTTFALRFLAVLAVAAVIAAFGKFVFVMDAQSQVNQKFEAICEYQGGTVEGDVCIKDSRVILDKSSFK